MVIFIAEQPPGLGRQRRPRFRRSEVTKATSEMVGGGGGKEEGSRGREPPLVYVIALPAAALPAVVSCLEAAVPRKARSCLPRAAPSAWWSWKIPVVPPPPPAKNPAEEEVRAPRPQRVRVAPSPDPATASPAKKPAKRARRCLHCHAPEAPQWRSRPMERSTLCNACGVLYRAMGALREHRPAARPVAEPLPESHIPELPQESPIWEPEVSPAIYLVRKPSKLRRPPRKEAAPVPPPRRSTKGSRSCLHCGSSKTPQWREGPMGHGTLCNACGVRYRQGRLLPEYRPIASPTFVPSEHANTHCRVLELRRRRHRQSKDPHPHPPSPPPQPVDSHIDPPIADDHPTDAPGSGDDLIDVPTSLDSLLLDGPSAPLIVDGDEFLIS